jgi:hypothetical protein
LQAIRNDYRSQGFEIIGIGGLNESWPEMLPYVRQYNWVFLHDLTGWPTWYAYRQNGYIPLNYVIDRAGIVRYWGEGFDEAAVRQAIEAWLPVGVEAGGSEKPVDLINLAQNRPNPSMGSAEITFSLPRTEEVHLAVYDAQGRLVKTLAEGTRSAGKHQVSVSGLGSGIYFYCLEAGKVSLTRRMVVAK